MKLGIFHVLYSLRHFYTNKIKNDSSILLKVGVRQTNNQIRDNMISHIKLKKIKELSKSVTLKADEQGYEFIVIDHQNFNAAFTLHGGHLIHFQQKHQAPLIYLSDCAIFNESKAIRGGVPICWPWFSKAKETLGMNLPSHGFARVSKWSVSTISEDSNGVNIDFVLASNAETKQLWDHDFLLTLKASLGDSVKLDLVTKNTGTQDFSYSGALHTYLYVENIMQCSIEGLAENYSDSLDSGKNKKAPAKLTVNAELDSIHQTNEGDVMIKDTGNQRSIAVTNLGNDSVVVWNPWSDKSAAMADMPDNGYQNMLCIESAITAENGVLVKAGELHTLSTVIKETAMK